MTPTPILVHQRTHCITHDHIDLLKDLLGARIVAQRRLQTTVIAPQRRSHQMSQRVFNTRRTGECGNQRQHIGQFGGIGVLIENVQSHRDHALLDLDQFMRQ